MVVVVVVVFLVFVVHSSSSAHVFARKNPAVLENISVVISAARPKCSACFLLFGLVLFCFLFFNPACAERTPLSALPLVSVFNHADG